MKRMLILYLLATPLITGHPADSHTQSNATPADDESSTIPGTAPMTAAAPPTYSIQVAGGGLMQLIANHLVVGDNSIDAFLPLPPEATGAIALPWNKLTQAVDPHSTFISGLGWLSAAPSLPVVEPGGGIFLQSPTAFTIEITGTLFTNPPPPLLEGKLCLVSRPGVGLGNWTNIVGSEPVDGAQLIQFDVPSQQYITNTFVVGNWFVDGNWALEPPTVAVGEAVFVTLVAPSPPTITQQPQSQELTLGQTAELAVEVTSIAPVTYQWQKNGILIPGANSPTLSLTDIDVEDVDFYSVTVNSPYGPVTSFQASIAVTDAFLDLSLPASFSLVGSPFDTGGNTLNDIVPFASVGAEAFLWNGSGYNPGFTFFPGIGWVDENFIPSADDINRRGFFLNIPFSEAPFDIRMSGTLRPPVLPLLLDTNLFSLVTPQRPLPSGYEDLTGLAPVEGATVDLWDPALQDYQTHFFLENRWTDGEPLVAAGAGAFVSFQPPLIITGDPMSFTNPSGDVELFVDVDAGRATNFVRYQWRLNGVNIPRATQSSYTITNAGATDGGIYQVMIRRGHKTASPGPAAGDKPEEVVRNGVSSAAAIVTFTDSPVIFPDDFPSRILLPASTGLVTGNNLGATREGQEPTHAGRPGAASVWAEWTAPADGIATFQTTGSHFDTLIAVYQGSQLANLVEKASDDDSGGFVTSLVSFNAIQGANYAIVIDGYNGTSGNIVLKWEFESNSNRIPVFTNSPVSLTVPSGAPATFRAATDSLQAETYVWYHDGSPLPGETSLTLTRPDVSEADLGDYWVVATNPNLPSRPKRSATATLAIGLDPTVRTTTKLNDLFVSPQAIGDGGSGGGAAAVAGVLHTHRFRMSKHDGSDSGQSRTDGYIWFQHAWLLLTPTNRNGIMLVDTFGSSTNTDLWIWEGAGVLNQNLFAYQFQPLASNRVERITEYTAPTIQGTRERTPHLRSWRRFEATAGKTYAVGVAIIDSFTNRLANAALPDLNGLVTVNWILADLFTSSTIPGPSYGVLGEPITLTDPNIRSVGTNANQVIGTFQWHFVPPMGPRVMLENETNATLTLPNLTTGDLGIYEVEVTSPAGTTINRTKVLEDTSGITNTLVLEPNSIVTLRAPTEGVDNWQWRLDSRDLVGETNLYLGLYIRDPAQTGVYSVTTIPPSGGGMEPSLITNVVADIFLTGELRALADTTDPDAVCLILASLTNRSYTVESTLDFLADPPLWETLDMELFEPTPEEVLFKYFGPATNAARFYRAIATEP